MTPRARNVLVRRAAVALRDGGVSPALYSYPEGLARSLVVRAEIRAPRAVVPELAALVQAELQAQREQRRAV